jgi:hypothetical protein
LNLIPQTTTARIFEDVGGFYFCSSASACLDARGRSFRSRAEALREAYRAGFTHAIGGYRRKGGKIVSQVSLDSNHHFDHARAFFLRFEKGSL